MAGTPSKRRKKNDHQSSNQPVRGLDFFFGKQQAAQKEQAAGTNGAGTSTSDKVNDTDVQEVVESERPLTDEEYALKLQAEFDEQDRLLAANNTNGERDDDGEEKPSDGGDVKHERDGSPVVKDTVQEGVKDESPAVEDTRATSSNTPTVNPFAAFGKKNTLSLQSATAEEDTINYTIPFDESPMTFDPQKYLPDLQKQWAPEGGRITYALLTQGFILINSTQSRIKIVDTLVNLLRTIIEGDPQSLLPAVWLATNSIAPPYIDLELGLGGSAISKALKKVCGLDNASLKKLSDRLGDAGDVAFEAKKRQSMTLRKPKPLTIQGVFDGLVKIANTKGSGSVENKQRIVDRLIQDARGAEESRYVVRTLVQHLRIGAVKTTMLIALSRAFLMSKPPGADFTTRAQSDLAKLNKQDLAEIYAPAEELVKACFARRPNYGDLVPALLEIGIDDELLLRCGLAMHIPMRPMLGGITRDLGEMLTKLEGRDFSCEFKYDGQRAQVHCDENGKVTIFSRHLEVMTDKYPDLVALIPKIRGEGISSFIMEGEVVAVDRETGDLKPFQILANRARKDVVIGEVKVDVCLFAFDLMYLNNEELMNRPFRERRNLLRSLFIEIPNHFTWVKSLDATSADQEQVSDFFKQATDIKCEGIMVKVLDNLPNPDLQAELDVDATTDAQPKQPPPTPTKAKKKGKKAKTGSNDNEDAITEKKSGRRKALLATYEPDKRLDSWLKVKKDYATHADTIDLIPVGGWHGSGRKNAWWSPILLACRNDETGSLEVVTKCMSGFTDAFYKANRERYDPESDNNNTLGGQPSYVEYRGGQPAVWFEPQEVWEMAFADVTLSPTYTAAIGLVSEERGLSLRFPRFLRVREDKSLEEASSRDFLAGLWRKQEARAPKEGDRVTAVDDGFEE
jgi:DNA ligase-1